MNSPFESIPCSIFGLEYLKEYRDTWKNQSHRILHVEHGYFLALYVLEILWTAFFPVFVLQTIPVNNRRAVLTWENHQTLIIDSVTRAAWHCRTTFETTPFFRHQIDYYSSLYSCSAVVSTVSAGVSSTAFLIVSTASSTTSTSSSFGSLAF